MKVLHVFSIFLFIGDNATRESQDPFHRVLARVRMCILQLFFDCNPPGGGFCWVVSKPKTWRKRTPFEKQPQFFQTTGVVLRGVPLPPGTWFGTHATKKPPEGGGFSRLTCEASTKEEMYRRSRRRTFCGTRTYIY